MFLEIPYLLKILAARLETNAAIYLPENSQLMHQNSIGCLPTPVTSIKYLTQTFSGNITESV